MHLAPSKVVYTRVVLCICQHRLLHHPQEDKSMFALLSNNTLRTHVFRQFNAFMHSGKASDENSFSVQSRCVQET